MNANANERAARAVWKRVVPLLPFALPAIVLAVVTIRAVVAKLGHPGAPLDDAYIHFQYARAIVAGHPLRFHAGEAYSSGATSLLWPALLAPFYLVGLRAESILWGAWALGFGSLALLGREAYLLTRKLAGAPAAIGAAAMVYAFGAFTWFAASGMEVVPFAWSMAWAVRLAAEHAEGQRPPLWKLIVAAWVTALMRPEGAVIAFFVAATLVVFAKGWRARLPAVYAALAPFFTPLVLLVFTGTARSTTAIAKLMPGNPYYAGEALTQAVKGNVSLLFGTLLNGEVWSAEFLPKGTTPFAAAGLVAVAYCGWRARSGWRAAGVLLIALLMLAPCFYITFLWNRLRYLWPFAVGWIIGFACLARALGDGVGAFRSRLRAVVPLLACGVACGLLGSRLDWVIEDVAQSASGIDRQQVTLGRWARANLPATARIGVNDTGAIAYFGERRTFDVVGLTSAGEARYWVGGAGSRLEHYERMPREKLPTHFIVYPEWMACEAVLGTPLHEAVVVDATILGGQTMRVYEADYSMLGSGDRPWSRTGEAIDTVDVADLESEAEHRYALLGARDGEQIARAGASPDGRAIVDGGRMRRTIDRFVARRGGYLVARMESSVPCRVHMLADGREIGARDLGGGDWQEIVFDLEGRLEETVRFEMRADSPVTVYHYWITPR